jgi:tRNA pseudouridine55 synthase
LHKPPGITSFKTLESLKSKKEKHKVGHTGTLDKFAEGLLIAVIGKMTKFSNYITDLQKEYIAEIRFGTETDTLDPEGKVTATACVKPSYKTVEQSLELHTGRIEQTPPIYSAVHSGGKRAYQLARNGADPSLKPRTVHVYEMELISYEYPLLLIRVVCSKGTYIRSLARDIARACGTVAFVRKLTRTKIGPFMLEEAVSFEDISLKRHLISPEHVFSRLGFVHEARVKNGYAPHLLEGKKISPFFFREEPEEAGLHAVFDGENRFLALIERNEKGFSYKFTGKD